VTTTHPASPGSIVKSINSVRAGDGTGRSPRPPTEPAYRTGHDPSPRHDGRRQGALAQADTDLGGELVAGYGDETCYQMTPHRSAATADT
jgi:hypothetical protein